MQSDTLRNYCLLMAAYNQNANATLYEACAELSSQELAKDKSAFFGSIMGTLNHIMVGDDIWMARFKEIPIPHSALNEVLFTDFATLKTERRARDEDIVTFFTNAGDAFYEGDFTFKSMAGDTFTKPVLQILSHFFNHQTHHRGQVHTLLTQSGIKTPVSDLPYLV